MGDEIRETEKRTEFLRAKNEEEEQKVSLEEKKARIAEAKRMYGKDWKKIVGGAVRSLRVNKETLQSLHSLGIGGSELRDLSNPKFLKPRR